MNWESSDNTQKTVFSILRENYLILKNAFQSSFQPKLEEDFFTRVPAMQVSLRYDRVSQTVFSSVFCQSMVGAFIWLEKSNYD